jgi:tetratricopeptide (TPR) repeat protein
VRDALELLPGPDRPVDEAWVRRVRALSDAEREALLREIDGLRDGEGADTALAAYRAMFDHLDPTRLEDTARIAWFARCADEDDLGAVLRLLEATPPGSPGRGFALLRTAKLERVLGRSGAAVVHCREILDAEPGPDPVLERGALLELTVCLVCEQRGFEAAVAGRRALERLRATGDLHRLAIAHMHLAAAYSVLEDWERFDRAATSLEEILPALPEDQRARIAVDWEVLGIDTAARRAEYDAALERLEAFVVRHPDAQDWNLAQQAALHLRRGDPISARDRLERLEALPVVAPWLRPWRETLRLLTDVALDPPGSWDTRLSSFLDAAEERQPEFSLAEQTGALEALAETLETRGRTEAARRTYALVAAKHLERVREAMRSWTRRSDILALDGEDRRTHRDLLARLRAEHQAISRVVAGLLARARDSGELPLRELSGEAGYLSVCAWCGRVQGEGGRWFPVGESLPLDDPLVVSHGICEDCSRDFLAER